MYLEESDMDLDEVFNVLSVMRQNLVKFAFHRGHIIYTDGFNVITNPLSML